jgi:hypothetical protein
MVEVIYRNDRKPAERIQNSLGNLPSNPWTSQSRPLASTPRHSV